MALHSWRVAAVLGLLVALVITIDAQRAGSARSVNWALHNLDLAGTRYSTMDQINRSNVAALAPRWLFQYGIIDGVSNQTTPVVVDGSMYLTDPRGSVYALDAADGHLLWSFDVTNLIGGGQREGYVFRNRGPVYADGVVYTAAGIVSVRARREDRQADPDVRTQRPGRCDHGRHPRRASRTCRRRSVSATGSRPLPRSTTASSTSAARAARATFPAVTCSPSTRRPAPCSGTSTRFRRTRTIRAGTSRARHGSAANATAAASGKRRRSIRSSA